MSKRIFLFSLFCLLIAFQVSFSETLYNLERENSLGFGGSYLYGLKIHEGYAYINSESGNLIIDVSDPLEANIVNLYQSKDLRYWYFDIQDNLGLFPVDEYNIHVVDMSDPAYPTPLGVMSNEDSLRFRYMKLHDDCAILCDTYNVKFYDISDPHSPQLVSTIAGINGEEYFSFIETNESYLYVCYGTGCTIIDFEDITSPAIVNILESEEQPWYQSLHFAHNRMYTYGYDGLRIWNIDNLESPELISFYAVDRESMNKAEISIYEDVLYITAAQVSRAISVEDENNPELLDIYQLDNGRLVKGQDIDGSLLYMSVHTAGPAESVESQMLIFDLSNGPGYELITDFCQSGNPRNVEVVDDYAYMYEIHSLTTISILNNNIELYGRMTNHSFRFYELDEYNGNILQYYYAVPDWNLCYAGIVGIDLNYPDDPIPAGNVLWSGYPRGRIYAHDQVHMITAQFSSGEERNSIISTVDIWDLWNIEVSDTTYLDGPAYGAAYVDDRMIIGIQDTTFNSYKLQALNIDENFQVTAELEASGAAWEIVSQGYYFYAVIYDEGNVGGTIDIYYFDSDTFTHVGTLLSFNQHIENIKVQNTKMLMSIEDYDDDLNYTTHKLNIYDLDDPASPELYASLAGTQTVYDFDFINENSLAVTREASFDIFTITDDFEVENSSIETRPSTLIIAEIYPNPFNSSSRIKVESTLNENVDIAVYDVLGREVSRLHQGVLESGTHKFTINSENLANGIYFLNINSKSTNLTRKLILVK